MPVVMPFLCVSQAQARQLCCCWECQGPRAEPGDGAGAEEEGSKQKHKSQSQPPGHGRQEAQQGHDPLLSSCQDRAAPSLSPVQQEAPFLSIPFAQGMDVVCSTWHLGSHRGAFPVGVLPVPGKELP